MSQEQLQLIITSSLLIVCLLVLRKTYLKKIKIYHSPISGEIGVFQRVNGEKLISLNGYLQSVSIEKTDINQSYWWVISQQILKFVKDIEKPQVLMLGLGGGTIPKLVSKFNPNIYQTIVEIDKMVVKVANEYFHIDKLPNLKIITRDAYKLVSQKTVFSNKFDVIVVDIFVGNRQMVPQTSSDPSFIQDITRYLKNPGIILINRPANTAGFLAQSLELKSYLETIFKKVDQISIKDPRGFKSHVLVVHHQMV